MNNTREITIKSGSRQVVIDVSGSHVEARVYVNNGETATPVCWQGKTVEGAKRWAKRALAPH